MVKGRGRRRADVAMAVRQRHPGHVAGAALHGGISRGGEQWFSGG